jgi:hypothetical protein
MDGDGCWQDPRECGLCLAIRGTRPLTAAQWRTILGPVKWYETPGADDRKYWQDEMITVRIPTDVPGGYYDPARRGPLTCQRRTRQATACSRDRGPPACIPG